MDQIDDTRRECKDNQNPMVGDMNAFAAPNENLFSQNTADDGFREYLLVAIRCARLRAQLLQNEIDEIGVALKGRMVTPDVALCWLSEIGAIQFIDIGELPQ